VGVYLNIAMLIVSIALVGVIILQSRGAGLGGLGGGSTGGSTYHVRRGVERMLFNITIGLSILFFALAVVTVVVIR
jgi:preprotein translocase subunit SecG